MKYKIGDRVYIVLSRNRGTRVFIIHSIVRVPKTYLITNDDGSGFYMIGESVIDGKVGDGISPYTKLKEFKL